MTTQLGNTLSSNIDSKTPNWYQAMEAAILKVSPREGWDVFLLMFGTVSVSAWVVREARWVETPGLMGVMFVSTVAGLAFAKTRIVPWPVAYVAGLLIGFVIVSFNTATLLERSLVIGMGEVWSRTGNWIEAAWSDDISTDLLPSTLILLSFAWLLGYLSSWFLFKLSTPWVGLTLGGIAMLTTLSFLPEEFNSRFFIFMLIAILLVARVSMVQKQKMWAQAGIGVITQLRNRFIGLPMIIVLSLLVITIAALVPMRVYVVSTAVDIWNMGRQPLLSFEDEFARLFSGIASKKNLDGRFFGKTLPFEGKISFAGDVVMWANSEKPTYWLSRSYDEYTSQGWKTSAANTLQVNPEGLPPPPQNSDNRTLAFHRIQLTFQSQDAFTGGNVDWVSRDAVVETLHPKFWQIDVKDASDDSGLPQDVQQVAQKIRQALDPPQHQFVKSIVHDLLPKDLLVMDITRGGDGNDWRNQQTVTLRRQDPEYPVVVNWKFKDPLPKDQSYSIYSFVSESTNNQLRGAGADYPHVLTDYYLQLPSSLPSRVRKLANQITESAKNPLDKALAIEQYLRSEDNFTYSQDIDRPPPDRDGVDWFLFETKTGYSDYFASSMVVMLRTVGIPSRMAVGYGPGNSIGTPGQRTIKDSDSHGWVQAFFPGHGWINFEPTIAWPAIERDEGDLADASIEESENQLGDLDAGDSLVASELDVCEEVQLDDPLEAFINPECYTDEEIAEASMTPEEPIASSITVFIYLAIGLLSIAGLWIVVWGIWNLRLHGKERPEKVYIKMRRLARLAGITHQPNQTPMEYSRQISAVLPASAASAEAIAWNFTVGRYSNTVPSPNILIELERHWKALRSGLISRTFKRALPMN